MIRRVGRSGRARSAAVVLALAGACGVLASCGSGSGSSSADSSPPTSRAPTSSPPSHLAPQTLTFGVVGSADEVAAYQQMASLFAPLNRKVTVEVKSWPDEAAMMADLKAGATPPDVFLASRRDLLWLHQQQVIQPVDQLLDDRGVDFGDDYPRSTLTALGMDNHLECLPWGVSPTVIYYNKRLLKLGRVPGDRIVPGQAWSLDQFAAAARWASSHHPGTAGAYVDPTIGGVAPFVLSGGGQIFNGSSPPTSLTMSSDASQQALARTVRALDRPGVSLTPEELEARPALQWFKRGQLALMEGSRDVVPTLRTTLGLNFDVMPTPDLDTSATAGGLTGMCISKKATDAGTAADFLVYASSTPALGYVASQGYLQPANQTVALSPAFQQPGRLPQHASVFTLSLKTMEFPALTDRWDELDAATDPRLARMLHGRPAQVPPLTRKIDRASTKVLHVPEAGASDGPTGGSSDGSGGSSDGSGGSSDGSGGSGQSAG